MRFDRGVWREFTVAQAEQKPSVTKPSRINPKACQFDRINCHVTERELGDSKLLNKWHANTRGEVSWFADDWACR